MINTANTSKIERATLIYNEVDILRDILRDLNNQAEHDTHRTMEEILEKSPYNPKWKSIIGYEGRQFKPAIKIEKRRTAKHN